MSRTGYFERGARSPEKFLIADPEPIRKQIAAMPGVEDVMGRVYFAGLLNNGRSDLPIVGEGVEPAREARLGSGMVITAGRELREKDEHGMMIGYGPGARAQAQTRRLGHAGDEHRRWRAQQPGIPGDRRLPDLFQGL